MLDSSGHVHGHWAPLLCPHLISIDEIPALTDKGSNVAFGHNLIIYNFVYFHLFSRTYSFHKLFSHRLCFYLLCFLFSLNVTHFNGWLFYLFKWRLLLHLFVKSLKKSFVNFLFQYFVILGKEMFLPSLFPLFSHSFSQLPQKTVDGAHYQCQHTRQSRTEHLGAVWRV